MAAEDDSGLFSTKQREDLFIELAKRETGTTAQEVFNESRRLGDTVTIEAYYNLARRLTHRGVLVAEKIDRQTNYKIGQHGEGQWLDEDRIATIVNPDYPLIALTVLQESIRQLNGVPAERESAYHHGQAVLSRHHGWRVRSFRMERDGRSGGPDDVACHAPLVH